MIGVGDIGSEEDRLLSRDLRWKELLQENVQEAFQEALREMPSVVEKKVILEVEICLVEDLEVSLEEDILDVETREATPRSGVIKDAHIRGKVLVVENQKILEVMRIFPLLVS